MSLSFADILSIVVGLNFKPKPVYAYTFTHLHILTNSHLLLLTHSHHARAHTQSLLVIRLQTKEKSGENM